MFLPLHNHQHNSNLFWPRSQNTHIQHFSFIQYLLLSSIFPFLVFINALVPSPILTPSKFSQITIYFRFCFFIFIVVSCISYSTFLHLLPNILLPFYYFFIPIPLFLTSCILTPTHSYCNLFFLLYKSFFIIKKSTIIGLVDRVFLLSHPKFHQKNFTLIIRVLLEIDYPLGLIFNTIELKA